MPLAEASIVQKNQGWYNTATSTATLAAATTPGNTVLLVTFRVNTALAVLANGFMEDVNVGAGGATIRAFHRNIAGAETSWPLDNQGFTDITFWFAYELALLDAITTTSQVATSSGVGVTTVSTGTTPTVTDADILCVAVHATNSAVTTISGQTNGFDVYHDDQSATAGGQNGTIAVSRLYPGVGGTYESTGTFGTSVTGLGAMLVYRSAEVEDVTPAVVGAA